MKIIFLIIVCISISNASFTKSGNVVTDSVTKLQWQDDTVGSSMNWGEAVGFCETLVLDGYTDWRLANINELKSIVDKPKAMPTIVNKFSNTTFMSYWSSTSYQGNKKGAWDISFVDGSVSHPSKSLNDFVRCVRAGQ